MKTLKEIFEAYQECPFYDKSSETEAQNDVGGLCDIGADFARSEMYDWAVACWEYIVGNTENVLSEVYVNLGVSYYYGNGVDVDYAKALHYYQLAAAKGNIYGQYNLAVALEYGKGIAKDKEKAISFYEKAARKGLNMAIDALIRLGIYDETYIAFYPRDMEDNSFTPNNI